MWNDPRWKRDIPNMFSIVKNKNVKYKVVALHRGTQAEDIFKEEKQVDYENDEFVYYFIGYTDNIMHTHGEKGKESHEYLAKVDTFIKETYNKAKQYHDDVTVIAYSDHGHIDLEEPYIDINNYFKSENLNVNNYIHLIESNYARFWFRNELERQEVGKVIQVMTDKGLGFVLDDKYKNQYHLNLNSQEHGELIFYLSAPHEFTKTIWGFGHSVKSGHGFEPTLTKHHGIFCSDKNLAEDRDFAYLVDVLPSVMEQLGIDRTEYTLRGKNIVNTIVAN
jgi:predicted AlkP superfamily pyrophosphatase or phosphodiesterase